MCPRISRRSCQSAAVRSNRGLDAGGGSFPPRQRAAAWQTSAAAGARHGLDGEAGECQLLGSWLGFGTWRLRTFPGARESEMGEPLDADSLSADSRAHQPTHVVSDLIERRIDRSRAMKGSERAGVSLKPTVGVTDGGNVRSRAVMRHGDEPLSTCRTRSIG